MGNYDGMLYNEPGYTDNYVNEVKAVVDKFMKEFKSSKISEHMLYEISWQINLALMELKKKFTRFYYTVNTNPKQYLVAVMLYDPYGIISPIFRTMFLQFQGADVVSQPQMGFYTPQQPSPFTCLPPQQQIPLWGIQQSAAYDPYPTPQYAFGMRDDKAQKNNEKIGRIISEVDPVMLVEGFRRTKESFANELRNRAMRGEDPDVVYDRMLCGYCFNRYRSIEESLHPEKTPKEDPYAALYKGMMMHEADMFERREKLRRADVATTAFLAKTDTSEINAMSEKHHVKPEWVRFFLKMMVVRCGGYPETYFNLLKTMEPSSGKYDGPWEFEEDVFHKAYLRSKAEEKKAESKEAKEASSIHPTESGQILKHPGRQLTIEEQCGLTRDQIISMIYNTLTKADPYILIDSSISFEEFVYDLIKSWNYGRILPRDRYQQLVNNYVAMRRSYPDNDPLATHHPNLTSAWVNTDTGIPKVNKWISMMRSSIIKVENHIASMNKSYLESILKEYHCTLRNLREWLIVCLNVNGGSPEEFITELIKREPYDPGKGGFTDDTFVEIMLAQPERKSEVPIPKHPCSDPNQELKPVDPNACATQTFMDLTKEALKGGTAKAEEPKEEPKESKPEEPEEPKDESKDDKFGLTPADLHEIHGQFTEPTVHTRPLMTTKEQRDNAIKEMDKILQANNLRSFSGLRLLLAMRSLKDLGINKVTANFIYSVTNNTTGATLVKYIDKGWVRKMDKYPFGPGNTYWYTLTAEGLNVIDKIDQYPVDWKLAYKNTTFNLSETMRRRVEAVMTATDDTECDASLEIYKHDLCKHRLMLSGLFRKDGNVLILTDTGRIFRKHLQEQRLAEGIENDPTI